MSKKREKSTKYILAIVSIVAVVAIVLLLYPSPQVSEVPSEEIELSPEECEAYGGEAVNTLGGGDCASDQTNIGTVVGLKCPCVCCAPAKEPTLGPDEMAAAVAEEHLRKYVHNAWSAGADDFFSRVTTVEVLDAEECWANQYWKRWEQGLEGITGSIQPCWEVSFYYKTPLHPEGDAYLIVYVDKETGEVIGGTQTK